MYIIWFKNVNVIYIYVYIKSTIWKPRISGIRELFRFRSDRLFHPFYDTIWETVWSIYIRILKGSRSGILRTGTKIWLGRRNPSYHERYTDEVLDLQQLVIDKTIFFIQISFLSLRFLPRNKKKYVLSEASRHISLTFASSSLTFYLSKK